METNPKLQIELTNTDKTLELLSWLVIVALWALAIFSYVNLPDIIPIHFNVSGKPDSYGDKSIIFLLPIIGTVLFLSITALNKYPHIFNYPVKITESNALKLYTISTRMIRFTKLAIGILFLIIVLIIYLTSKGITPGFGAWFIPLVVALFIIPNIYFIIKLYKSK